ncbi:MAG: hypothetical protein U9O54_03660 [Chloroflexota bacterium]|nr:hypothetical protein [Chloroflexota bacterium]
MTQQLSFDDFTTATAIATSAPIIGDPSNFMLWYENTDAKPEQAIKNASQYYLRKYGIAPVRVVLPLKWREKDHSTIKIKPLEEALGLVVTTSKVIITKHVAVYSSLEE